MARVKTSSMAKRRADACYGELGAELREGRVAANRAIRRTRVPVWTGHLTSAGRVWLHRAAHHGSLATATLFPRDPVLGLSREHVCQGRLKTGPLLPVENLHGIALEVYIALVLEAHYDEVRWVGVDEKGKRIRRRRRPPLDGAAERPSTRSSVDDRR